MNQPTKYGLAVGAVLFVVGWITGMGGSFLPNLIFSALMGAFAGGLYWLAQKVMGKRDE